MNRIQFWILVGLSCVTVVLAALQITYVCLAQTDQARIIAAQQIISQGRTAEVTENALARRIYELSQQFKDPAVLGILARHQITVRTPDNQQTDNSTAPAPSKH